MCGWLWLVAAEESLGRAHSAEVPFASTCLAGAAGWSDMFVKSEVCAESVVRRGRRVVSAWPVSVGAQLCTGSGLGPAQGIPSGFGFVGLLGGVQAEARGVPVITLLICVCMRNTGC